MKYGDFQTWATEGLHNCLTKVINAMSWKQNPYYILAIFKKGYMGPPRESANELLNTGESKIVDMDFEGKVVLHTRLTLCDQAPPVPMIGTALWYVNNSIGEVKCIYVLPPDKPVAESDEAEEVSELVFESAQKSGVSLVWPN
jgi:hypothetical protein